MKEIVDKYATNIKSWNNVAELYQQRFMSVDLYNDTYNEFLQLILSASCSVLEIGCGPGNITRYLCTHYPYLNIEAIDVAPAMIALAKQNNPAVRFRVMDCRDIATLQGKYDAIMCGFCLPYLSKQDAEKLLKDCSGLLSVAGTIYLSTIEGEYETSGFETSSNGTDKMYVYYYSEQDLLNMLEENSFSLVNLFRKEYLKNDGSTSVHLILIAKNRRNKNSIA